MSWAARRQLVYFLGVLVFVALVGFGIFRHATSVPPSCSDGKQNQGEAGVDCGGPCVYYCPGEIADPKVRWVRSFQIAPGVVHAVAYIEHTAPRAGVLSVPYSFKLYDDQNALVAERAGTTFIGAMGRSAIVETLISVGTSIPTTTRFTFSKTLPWQHISPDFAELVIKPNQTKTELVGKGLRMTSTLQNTSRATFTDLGVVAILYDREGNALTVSRSVVESLAPLGTAVVYFTWPTAPSVSVDHIEIIPQIDPFTTTL